MFKTTAFIVRERGYERIPGGWEIVCPRCWESYPVSAFTERDIAVLSDESCGALLDLWESDPPSCHVCGTKLLENLAKARKGG